MRRFEMAAFRTIPQETRLLIDGNVLGCDANTNTLPEWALDLMPATSIVA